MSFSHKPFEQFKWNSHKRCFANKFVWCKYESDSHRIWQHKSTKHRTLSNWHFSCGQWRHFDVSIKSSRAICRIEYLCFECKLREKKLLPIWFHQVQQKAPIEAFSSIEFYSPKKGKHKLKLFKSKKKKHIQPRERTIPLSINKTKRERERARERERNRHYINQIYTDSSDKGLSLYNSSAYLLV